MELHLGKPEDGPDVIWPETLEEAFSQALTYTDLHHNRTLEHYRSFTFDQVSVRVFWSEYVWCVYTSGFNAKVISKKFDALMTAIGPWDWKQPSSYVLPRVLKVFGNERKATSILRTRELLGRLGWDAFKEEYLASFDDIARLPYIGGITKYHLARNLGLDYVKPDIHLVRLADYYEFEEPEAMCAFLSGLNDERLGVVDFILWAYSAAYGTKELE